jgi:hypothetical protein
MNTLTHIILRYFLILVAFIATNTTILANKFEPSVVILTPYEVNVDEALKEEIAEENLKIDSLRADGIAALKQQLIDSSEETENIKLMNKKQIEFQQKSDFIGFLSTMYVGYLQYALYESFPNLLVYASDLQSEGELSKLKEIADSLQVQYIVNFSSINIYKDGMTTVSKIRVQLYDNKQNTIILNNEYYGNSENPGFEFACTEGSITCTFSNISNYALKHIINLIFANNKPKTAE